MKKFIIQNQKTGEKMTVGEKNRNGLAMLFYTALANWEIKGCECWEKYCEKYKTVEEYDKHLDNLEKEERKEFFANLLENNNKYNNTWKIIQIVKEEEKEIYISFFLLWLEIIKYSTDKKILRNIKILVDKLLKV